MAKKQSNTTITKATASRKQLKQSAQNVIGTVNAQERSRRIHTKQTGGESASFVSNHSAREILEEPYAVRGNVEVKLTGSYKGKRKWRIPEAIVIVECPGCGWRTQPAVITEAEIEYVLHIENVHHGILECAFCDPAATNRGQRILPTFETLAAHVRHFHPERFHDCAEDTMGAIPRKAFR